MNSQNTFTQRFAQGALRLALAAGTAVLLSSSAWAQYGGPGGGGMGTGTAGSPGYTAPKSGYGNGKAIGIGVGAAAGVGGLFLALHHRGSVTGCVKQTDDGMALVDEKKNKSYALDSNSIALKPGDRVQLRGKKSSGPGGAESFQATKVVKVLGACELPAQGRAAGAAPSASAPQ